jgi:hypothetical protein
MNRSVRSQELVTIALPAELAAFDATPLLLPGEEVEHYRSLRQAVFTDIAPQSAIEWLLAIDVAEASWEIQRYRLLRQRLLEFYREKAVEAALNRIDLAGIAPELRGQAAIHTRQNALSWRIDPCATREIDVRLASYGFDLHAVNVEVFIQARETFLLFESLIHGAQVRRTLLLREIRSCRLRY